MHPELVNLILFARCLLKVALYTGLILGLAVVVFAEVVFAHLLNSEKERF